MILILLSFAYVIAVWCYTGKLYARIWSPLRWRYYPFATGALIFHKRRRDWEKDQGCCTNCNGTGVDYGAPETNGKCWDCYGTGHTHL